MAFIEIMKTIDTIKCVDELDHRIGGYRPEAGVWTRFEPKGLFIAQAGSAYDLNSTSPTGISGGITPTYIIKAFEEGPIHMFAILGSWWLDDAADDNRDILVRSKRIIAAENKNLCQDDWPSEKRLSKSICQRFARSRTNEQMNGMILRYGPQSFLLADEDRIIAYSTTLEEAENIAADFEAKYAREVVKENGTYVLIRETEDGIDTHSVALQTSMRLEADRLTLHYGNDVQDWHKRFVGLLAERPHGISIFEGEPGTGKTSYIRHLICELEDTHRFYFLSPSQLEMLSRPYFVDFWIGQAKRHADKQFVVILEDAENALMVRGTDNSRMVSTILNLTDGIMAEFLKLQFICTINCKIAEIDSALLRPGRLLTHRHFRKLGRAEAVALADSLGKTLPENNEFTLAEIFAVEQLTSPSSTALSHSRIGFGK